MKIGTILYRAGGTGTLPEGTLQDAIDSELKEHGKCDIQMEWGYDPSQINTKNLLWVCATADEASSYGDVHPEVFNNFLLIAKDSVGRMLIEHSLE